MPRRRPLVLGITLLILAALLAPSPALARSAAAEEARWKKTASFLSGSAVLDETLRAEVASNGRAMVTFTRTGIESSCGRSKTRIRGLEGRWRDRPTARQVSNSDQVQLVAGRNLAWLGAQCSGAVELRYMDRASWREPAVLPGLPGQPLRAGMNATGLVALARPVGAGIEVFSARRGEAWAEETTLSTDGAAATVDHVAVTDSEQLVVVWHAELDMRVSTLDAGVWSTAEVPGDVAFDRVVAGSDTAGNILIARAAEDRLYANFRAAAGTVTEPERVGEGLVYGCSYVCMAVEVLPGGDSFVAWSGGGLLLGRRDAGTGEWVTERAAERFSALNVRLDAHVDGGVVAVDSTAQVVYTCSWTSSCSVDDYPPRTDHGMFAAAPEGEIVGISGLSYCDDWCDFQSLDGWERRPVAGAGASGARREAS